MLYTGIIIIAILSFVGKTPISIDFNRTFYFCLNRIVCPMAFMVFASLLVPVRCEEHEVNNLTCSCLVLRRTRFGGFSALI